jgi:hypothetical protein
MEEEKAAREREWEREKSQRWWQRRRRLKFCLVPPQLQDVQTKIKRSL